MKRYMHAAKSYFKDGKSWHFSLSPSEPYTPFGEDFGLTIFPEYLSPKEQTNLRCGYSDVYIRRTPSIVLSDGRYQLPPIEPSSFLHLVERIEQDQLVPKGWLNSQTSNLFEPGDFIRAHVDNLFVYDDIFAVVSLGSNAMLKFVHVQNGEELQTVIPGSSLYILSGPARYVYFHMVLPTEEQRFSIVFRRSILRSDGGFRTSSTFPTAGLLPFRANAILNTLYSKQVGSVRLTVDDEWLEAEKITAFDTSRWVKSLKPLRDWSLLAQVTEDEARVKELVSKKHLEHDFAWRFKELREYYKGLDLQLNISPK